MIIDKSSTAFWTSWVCFLLTNRLMEQETRDTRNYFSLCVCVSCLMQWQQYHYQNPFQIQTQGRITIQISAQRTNYRSKCAIVLALWNMSSRLTAPWTFTLFYIHAEDRKPSRRSWRRSRRGKRRQRQDLSLPADVECAPGAPSQQPGQFTSCKIDWLSMDPCPCMAANSELIKEHFSGETLSSNQAHPIHSQENMLL